MSSVDGLRVQQARADGRAVLDRLRELPGGSRLLEVAAAHGEVELVGGAVRDLLLNPKGTPRELDVVVSEDSLGLAGLLAGRLSLDRPPGPDPPTPHVHDRFGTATVEWPGGRIDIAERRGERYAHPGALPEVHRGSVEEDLARRDFTVNAMAVALAGPREGELHGVDGALDDLAARRLRVLHEGSFLDDPTRLMRMARYRARLGFEPDEQTARLAGQAIDTGALDTVSRARIGAELRLALAEPDPVAALESMQQLGLLSALHEAIELDAPLARAALAELPSPPDAWPDVLLLASLLRPGHSYDSTDYQTRLRALLDSWEFPGPERERTVRSAILSPRIAERLQQASKPSQIYAIAHGEPLEAIALGGAIAGAGGRGDAADAARRWLSQLRHVKLEIAGDDLLAAGISAGPEIGRRLRHALMRKLDGELVAAEDERALELAAALEEA
jgi:tRNA nucleotidyltransferase (CCA-adding enzyme)